MHSRAELQSLYGGEPSYENMEGYIYITLIPKLRDMRKEKTITEGHWNKFDLLGETYNYYGDQDSDGNMVGWGLARLNDNIVIESTFLDNKPEGVLHYKIKNGNCLTGEYLRGKKHGR